ncbi:MAG TPA: tetratricopeptide repeat protein [Candidatus Angelobacter sp.]|nr:tetratricopeptide repeat protein [Candidatus Angelobacter sp.]
MRKVLVTFVLALTTAAWSQGSSPSQQPAQQPAAQQPAGQQSAAGNQQANTPTSQKVIKDPAEYNAYMAALNTTDPAAKGAAMEAFVAQYPNSIVKVDALQQAMGAYQQAQNQPKVEEQARKILQIEPNDVRALAILTYLTRVKAQSQNNPATLAEACGYAQKGSAALPSWQKPEGVEEADYEKQKPQMQSIFEETSGLCALNNKDYAGALTHYENALKNDPNNMEDTYQIGFSMLSANPQDIKGFWYIAKAINLANAQKNANAATAINNWGKGMYKRYHGTEDGWDQIVAAAATQNAIPADFAIAPKPTDCDIAADAAAKNDVSTLSVADWEFILAQRDCAPKGKEAADKVWDAIQAKQKDAKGNEVKIKMPQVKVISATTDSVDAALTEDNQGKNQADVHLVLEKPVTKPPAPGSMIDIVGVFTNYTPKPFMFTMEKGELPGAKPTAKTPAKKGVAKKKTTKKS